MRTARIVVWWLFLTLLGADIGWTQEKRPATMSYYFSTDKAVTAEYVAKVEQQCALHDYCRQLHRTGEYIASAAFSRLARLHLSGESTRLPRLASPLLGTSLGTPLTVNLSSDLVLEYVSNLEDMLALSRLIIAQLALNPQRCSSNKYWFWNERTRSGQCQCFIDRDCTEEATRLAQIEVHPILIIITIVLVLAVAIFIIVRIVYTPFGIVGRRLPRSNHDRREAGDLQTSS
jgi:hypothetical protein